MAKATAGDGTQSTFGSSEPAGVAGICATAFAAGLLWHCAAVRPVMAAADRPVCRAVSVAVLNPTTTVKRNERLFAGPEDITVDRERAIAYISASPRIEEKGAARANAHSLPQGGLYTLDLAELNRCDCGPLPLHDLTSGVMTGVDFHPHGLSLWIDPVSRGRTLFVINHPQLRDANGDWKLVKSTVERFTVSDDGLALSRHRPPTDLVETCNVNDVAAIDADRFLITDSTRGCTTAANLWDLLTGRRTGRVLLFSKTGEPAEVIGGLAFANGITIMPTDAALGASSPELTSPPTASRTLMVADSIAGEVRRYRLSFEPEVRADEEAVVLSDAGVVDNLEWDADGRLIVAAHQSLWRFFAYGRCHLAGLDCEDYPFTANSPSAVYRLDPNQTATTAGTAERLLPEAVAGVSGVSVAVVAGRRLLLGSVLGNKLTVCDLDTDAPLASAAAQAAHYSH